MRRKLWQTRDRVAVDQCLRMAERVRRLREVLIRKGALRIWEEENMNLWRMNTVDQHEAWYAPAGEVFSSPEEVADFLIKLPQGGTKAMFIQSAPVDDWKGLEIEIQDVLSAWNRATIIERQGYSTCLVQFAKDKSRSDVDLFNLRVRWVSAKSAAQVRKNAQKHAADFSDASKGKKSKRSGGSKCAIRASGSEARTLHRRRESAPLLRDEVMKLRRIRLKSLCEKGAEVLADRRDSAAQSIASYLEAVDAVLLDLEQSVDRDKELETREEVTSTALEYFSTSNSEAKDKYWKVKFLVFFSGSRAGSYSVIFESENGEKIEGIPGMARYLKAFQCSIDETDDGWCYYRSLDVINMCDEALDAIARNSAIE